MQNEDEGSETSETKRNILCLSDEVLVNICTYLTSEDLMLLSCTCRRFNDLLYERKLIRCMNLRAAYSLTPNLLRSFFRPLVRCERVVTISLASCYWLTSSEVLCAVQRLTNLKQLHVNDTNLSMEHLTRILKNIKSIECLSWTFHVTPKMDFESVNELSAQMHSLKSLNLWAKGFFVPFIVMLLEKCTALEEIKVSFYKARDIPVEFSKWKGKMFNTNPTRELDLPNVKSLILDVPEYLYQDLLVLLRIDLLSVATMNDPHMWNCLWLYSRFDINEDYTDDPKMTKAEKVHALCLYLQKPEFLHMLNLKSLKYFVWDTDYSENYEFLLGKSSITHLRWNDFSIPHILPESLQHLYIECYRKRRDVPSRSLISYDTLAHLTCLSAPACVLLAHSSGCVTCLVPPEDEAVQTSSGRQSRLRTAANADCFLKILTETAPNIKKLEIKCQKGCNVLAQEELASLALICWSQLETLVLENIPLIDISILVTVCSNCPTLRRFGLRHVGISAEFSQTWSFVQAINLLENLEDFIFEHPVVSRLMTIVDALSQIPTLRRVSIISERTSTAQNLSSYFNLIEKCSHLVFFFVRVASITNKMEKFFQKEMKVKFLNERKSLWASFQGTTTDDFWESVPTIHLHETVVDPALSTIIPPLQY